MRWRRGAGGGGVENMGGRGGGLGMPVAGGGLGLVGLVIYLLINVLSGGGASLDPRLNPLPQAPAPAPAAQGESPTSQADADLVDFVRFVVNDVQQTWTEEFQQAGRAYEPTTLRLFSGGVDTGCGPASSETGPFYCPADRHVYLDLGFFRELSSRFGAPGDFAQAYVIAHEFGHHVQNLTGISDQMQRDTQADPSRANDLSIRLELQADCLAGVWGHSAYEKQELEQGDLEEGLQAAAAVGDDRLQQEATGRIDRETWTHGSSEQRVKWFKQGFDTGDPGKCDTFHGDV